MTRPDATPLPRIAYTVAEAAALLRVSQTEVYRMTERGELPCKRIGRRKFIPRRAVDAFFEDAS